eukprot:jgi/Tetstr1/458536/TSEL_044939.t1
MMELIANFRGDVDCFAGDAVLVVFEPRKADTVTNTGEVDQRAIPGQCRQEGDGNRGGSSHGGWRGGNGNLSGAVGRALACAKVVHARLDGFRNEPEDPPLGVHSALAAGELVCVEFGGKYASRSEAFMIGPPLKEIAAALAESKTSQIVLAPSAVCEMGPTAQQSCQAGNWSACSLATGSLLLAPMPLDVESSSEVGLPSYESSSSSSAGAYKSSFRHKLSLHSKRHQAGHLVLPNPLYPTRAVLARMLDTGEDKQTIGRDYSAHSGNAVRKNMSMRLWASLQGKLAQPATAAPPHAPPQPRASLTDLCAAEERDAAGLDALLRFMPQFVRSKCVAGHSFSALMEHRTVTTMFVIASMEELEGKYTDPAWLRQLQDTLGACIDAVESRMGGATRQITVDDKGLAMIFVFGLPGYRSHRQTLPCILATGKVLDLVATLGVAATAGVSMGACFCGLVGHPGIRCEYAVMGGEAHEATFIGLPPCLLLRTRVFTAGKTLSMT